MELKEFIDICANNKIDLSEKQINQFIEYAELLKSWNEKINLTAITELEEVLEKHFLDSLMPSFHEELSGVLCDVGAGAGFPSIPLKIAYPHLSVIILEPIGKRVNFLNELVKKLELKDVIIKNVRAEDYAKEHREEFDIVTARAVSNLQILSELCIPLVKHDGLFIAMKGSNGMNEAKDAEKAISKLGCKLESVQEEELNEAIRINLFYRKTKKTPTEYPRAYGRIKKDPL